MGVPYSHISPEEQAANRILNKNMVTNSITCCICKEEQSWEEPKGSTSTNLMPDGALTNDFPGAWICLDCMYCKECTEDLLENECICEPKIILAQGTNNGI